MGKTGIFMADGCEEIEGLAVVDILRRAGLEVTMISIGDTTSVTGSHKITFLADTVFEQANFDEFDAIALPGGMPGTLKLGEQEGVLKVIQKFASEGKLVCAICAAPSVLGAAGLLDKKCACCYPGFEDKLKGAAVFNDPVIRSGNIITSRGMGTAIDFALEIVRYFKDDDAVNDLKDKIIYHRI